MPQIAALGPGMLLVVVAVVAGGIAGTLLLGRVLGVPFAQRLLIACGFSICGAAAIAAVEGATERKDEDVAASIALVVVFGTLMIPAVPLVAGLAGFDAHASALLAGASVHEVAQVVATASLIGPAAVGPAVVVKLARVALLAPVVVVVGWYGRRAARSADGAPAGPGAHTDGGATRPPLVPLFLVGFLAASLVSTLLAPGPAVLGAAATLQGLCLGAAMFALGVSVRVATLRRLGRRPVLLGLGSTVLVTGIALAGIAAAA